MTSSENHFAKGTPAVNGLNSSPGCAAFQSLEAGCNGSLSANKGKYRLEDFDIKCALGIEQIKV